jgi:hypothetical protein
VRQDAEEKTLIGKKSKMTVGLAMGLVGTLSYAAVDHSLLANTVRRVDTIEVIQRRHQLKVEKWLSAIGQKLRVPEPPAE